MVFDLVANHSFSEHRRGLTPKGTYVGAGVLGLDSVIGLLTGWITELVSSPFVSQKFVRVMAKLSQQDLTIIAALMEAGKVTPVIDRCYNLSEAAEAIGYLEEKHARGKVVITLEK
jgi:NADPH:quinone reductase-like Zn-dependent oxidoreductase